MDECAGNRGVPYLGGYQSVSVGNVKWTDEVAERVLSALLEHGQHSLAARAAGVSRESVRTRRAPNSRYYDAEFSTRYEEALELFCDELEVEARRRAVDGYTERPLLDPQGKVVGEVRKYSDKLLKLLIQRHRREFTPCYAPRAEACIELTMTPDELDQLTSMLDDEGLVALQRVRRHLQAAASARLE